MASEPFIPGMASEPFIPGMLPGPIPVIPWLIGIIGCVVALLLAPPGWSGAARVDEPPMDMPAMPPLMSMFPMPMSVMVRMGRRSIGGIAPAIPARVARVPHRVPSPVLALGEDVCRRGLGRAAR